MAKKKKKSTSGGNIPLPKSRKDDKASADKKPEAHPSHNATREVFESLAIAFILAFLIRTFVVEPFVIPTGSMSPALQGVHKDLSCPQCGQRYRVNASVQSQIRGQTPPDECVGGMCPMCRYTMAYDMDYVREKDFPDWPDKSRNERSYSGDRIIVNKFLYSFAEPERWDVVVFKYPGNATDNYIKRLVGLPEETLQIFGGDLFTKANDDDEFEIARKPPRIAYAMREPVHDTDHDPANLHAAGWPLRWQAEAGWQSETSEAGNLVRNRFQSDAQGQHWLRYEHTPPQAAVWPKLEARQQLPDAKPQLVSDFNPYNTRITPVYIRQLYRQVSRRIQNPFVEPEVQQGIHWVGDLFVEANVENLGDDGELHLELIEAGNRFRCTVDMATGQAQFSIVPHEQTNPVADFKPTASTSIQRGKHRVMFANVDDALLLWVDDNLVEFDQPTTFDWQSLFGNRMTAAPQTSKDDMGDLAPARIGTQDASIGIDRLRVYRDIYYIAADYGKSHPLVGNVVTDYLSSPPTDVLSNPEQWDLIAKRRPIEFPIATDQFFVMGDNSPQSSDARLWNQPQGDVQSGVRFQPGGNYLERQLLVGRAISVVWPHPWNYVIPSLTDMRRIR